MRRSSCWCWVTVGISLLVAMPGTTGQGLSRPPVAPALLGPGDIGPPAPDQRIRLKSTAGKTLNQLVDACVQGAMIRQNTPGAAVAVIDGGEMLVNKGYGVKRRGGSSLVEADTLFRIGSVTKQLTAAAVMQLVESGAVDLDDPVTLYVPELALNGVWPADRITVRHLLTHTSGYPDNFVNVVGTASEEALSEWVTSQNYVQLHAPPGSFWNYSNPNFSLAGLVVERASGIPYHEYMETRIFEEARLERTTLYPTEVMADGDWSFGHYQPPNGPEIVYEPDSYDNWAMAPAGFAFSTASDLARWALLLMDGGGTVLSEQSSEAMQGPQVDIEMGPDSWYGYGVFYEHYEGLELYQHGGNIPGWGTMLLWVPERRAAVAVVANTFESLGSAAYCIVDHVFGPPGGEPPDLSPDPALWPKFVGRYPGRNALGIEYDAVVEMDGAALTLDLINPRNPSDHLLMDMVSLYWNTFAVDLDQDGALDLDLTFHLSDGDPERVEWLVNRQIVGQRAVAPRSPGGRSN